MAESQEDKSVDELIAQMQATLDKLKAAQRKDVDDEDSEEANEPEPKNLRGAERKAQRLARARKGGSDE